MKYKEKSLSRKLASALLCGVLLVSASAFADTVIRVNAGGAQYTDTQGNVWAADTGYNTGSILTVSGTTAIAGTSDPALYRDHRSDPTAAPDLTYSFTVPNGTYQVKLHFAEIWSGGQSVGARRFNVLLEGTQVLTNLDVFAEVGGYTALIKTFQVTVADGQMTIGFTHGSADNPEIDAIEILSVSSDTQAPTVPIGLSATAVSAMQANLSWTASTDNGGGVVAGYRVFRNGVSVGTTTSTSYTDTGLSASTQYSYTVAAYDNASPANESVPSSPVTVTTPTANNLVGHWKLDESSGTSASDSSGNGHTGTLANSPTWATGRVNGGLSFNGTSGIVDIGGGGNLADLYTTGLTVSAWIKPVTAGGSGRGRIVEKYNSWFFAMASTTTLRFGIDQFSVSSPMRLTGASIVLNQWQHVVATWNGGLAASNIHFYINGVSSDGATTEGEGTLSSDASVPLGIGNRTSQDRGFDGVIDDVRIYNRVLSATEIQALADATVPTAPSAPSATAASSSQINVSWTASTDNVGVTGYRVERCLGASCTTFAEVGTPSASPFNDSGLTASTTYRYRIRAIDANTNLSSYSSVVSATTSAGGGGDTTPPSTPTSFTATAASSTQINLSWTASTDNVGVTGYLVERCQGAGCSTFSQIATPTGTTYNDTGLTASTSYSYRVRARDAVPNYSGYSSTQSATTSAAADTTAPSTPSGFSVTPQLGGQNNLAWNASTDNVAVTGYLIERCAGVGCANFAQIATTTTVLTYNDSGLVPTTNYSYRVRARDAVPNYSSYSNVDSATPADCD